MESVDIVSPRKLLSMQAERLFPIDLLKKSDEERLGYFRNFTMAHPHLDFAFEQIKPFINYPGETKVINIVGPTAAGKTTLRKLLENWIVEELSERILGKPGYIPFASVTASLHERLGVFDPKTHFIRSLEALGEPKEFINQKINYGTSNVFYSDRGQLVVKPKVLQNELGWALEQALKHRKPIAFFIDEAHHALIVFGGRKLSDMPEAIKSLAILTEVLHCLVGTYDLLALQDVGDQLTRRSCYIHLPRYDAHYTEDRETWKDIIATLQVQVPILELPDLLSLWEFLYDRCLGCMGILKNLIECALADALEEGSNTITFKHLERRAMEAGMAFNILTKIKEGERRFEEMLGSVEKLRRETGLDVEPISRKEKKPQVYLAVSTPANEPMPEAKVKRGRKVGQRNPKRDPVRNNKQTSKDLNR